MAGVPLRGSPCRCLSLDVCAAEGQNLWVTAATGQESPEAQPRRRCFLETHPCVTFKGGTSWQRDREPDWRVVLAASAPIVRVRSCRHGAFAYNSRRSSLDLAPSYTEWTPGPPVATLESGALAHPAAEASLRNLPALSQPFALLRPSRLLLGGTGRRWGSSPLIRCHLCSSHLPFFF